MDAREEPRSPTFEFKAIDDTSTTFELFDEGSAIQNRKRRRSSLRRVSFAERPSIHVFARDDDYETPPEGTTSHFSAQSSPSLTRSPQRRSERLASKGKENDVDKENVPVSISSSGREGRRGRRPLTAKEKEKEEEYLKPSNWLDDQDMSAFGSCDENTGPVDLRHISFADERMALEDDDNVTMDSQTFHTRMSQVHARQPLQPLCEEKFVEVATPRSSDMDLTILPLAREVQVKERPTWHRGDDSLSDMSLVCFESSPKRALQLEKSLPMGYNVQDPEQRGIKEIVDKATSIEEDSDLKRSRRRKKTRTSLPTEDTISMETTSQSQGHGQTLNAESNAASDERIISMEHVSMDITRAVNENTAHKTPVPRKSTDSAKSLATEDTISMETTSQSQGHRQTLNAESNAASDERIISMEHVSMDITRALNENTAHKTPVPRKSTDSAKSLATEDTISMETTSQSQGHGQTLNAESNAASDERIISMEHVSMDITRALNENTAQKTPVPRKSTDSAKSLATEDTISMETTSQSQGHGQTLNGEGNAGFDDRNISMEHVSMDITRALNENTAHKASVPRRSTDSAKSFLWVDNVQDMDMSDSETTDKFRGGATELIPKLKDLLDAYNPDSPAVPMINRSDSHHAIGHIMTRHDFGLVNQDPKLQTRNVDMDSKRSLGSLGDQDTVSMDTGTTLGATRPNLKAQGEAMFEDGATEAIPKFRDLLDAYNSDSSAIPMIHRSNAHPAFLQDSSSQSLQRVECFEELNYKGVVAKKRAFSSMFPDTGGVQSTAVEEENILSSSVPENSNLVSDSNVGCKLKVFRNPEDTFSFRVPRDSMHQESTRKSHVTLLGEQTSAYRQERIPDLTFPKVQEIVHSIEANLRDNQSASRQILEQNFQDGDTTGEIRSQQKWLADASSDMDTTPLSPIRLKISDRLINKPQGFPVETGVEMTASPSLEDGIAAAMPTVKDILVADVGSPESVTTWNPRRISWSSQNSNHQTLGDMQAPMHQPMVKHVEDETMHSMPDNLCTPKVQHSAQNKGSIFEYMAEDAENTLTQLSHMKEVQNSAANRMMQRLVSLKSKGPIEGSSLSDEESSQDLRRSLIFAQNDSQPQGRLMKPDTHAQQFEPENVNLQAPKFDSSYNTPVQMRNGIPSTNKEELPHPRSTNVVDAQIVDEGAVSTRHTVQETNKQQLTRDLQVAEGKLAALERRSAELLVTALEYHQAIVDRCKGREQRIGTKKWTDLVARTNVNKLKKRYFLLRGMKLWDLKSTKTGNNKVTHEFNYWSLLRHSIRETKGSNLEITATKSKIDLNLEVIDQVFRHMNASLAWKAILTVHERTLQPHSLLYFVQDINFKVTMLLGLMEEVNECRKYLVIPKFQLPTDRGLQISLQFSNSELLFSFIVLLDLRDWKETEEWLNRKQEVTCEVRMKASGRLFGKRITVAQIKDSVASVTPGHLRLLRICASVDSLIDRLRSEPKNLNSTNPQQMYYPLI